MAGSPRHPSYPAGHAVQNGAFAAVLKVGNGLYLKVVPVRVVIDGEESCNSRNNLL